jgi:hypothetical protein
MHRIKKAISELRDYLGRDTEGLRRLSEVETIANDVRKQVVLGKERADYAVEKSKSANKALRDAQDVSQQLETELHREQHIRLQRERDVETWKQEANKLQKELNVFLGPDEPSPSETDPIIPLTIRSLRSNCRQIRRHSRLCPKPIRIIFPKHTTDPNTDVGYHAYDLKDIIKNLSVSDFTALGRFVAVLAIVGFPCVIVETSEKFRSKKGWGEVEDIKEDIREKVLKHFLPWFRSNLDLEPAASMGKQRVKVGERLP